MSRSIVIPAAAVALALLAAAEDPPRFSVSLIGKGFEYTAGPAWSKDGYLIFSDTSADSLWKWTPGSDAAIYRKSANGPAGNAFDTQGRLYTCETHARRLTRTTMKDGHIEVIADQWEGKKFNAPSDLAVSRNDNVYFTDPAFGEQADHRELDFYGVYHLPPKGALKLVAKPVGRPNGIALSSNGRLLYVSNADERNVRAYDIDRNGDTSNERVLIAKTDGVPAGVRVNDKGELYLAIQKGIARYAPDGKLLGVVPLQYRPSNGAFDPDGKTFYVTSLGYLIRLRPDVQPQN